MNISEEQLYDIIDDCLQQTDENDYIEFKDNKANRYIKYIPIWA